MDSTRITITIDAGTDILAALTNAIVGGRGAGTSQAAVTGAGPSTREEANRKGKAETGRAVAKKNESSKRRKAESAAVVQRSRSPIGRRRIPPLPYPPKHKINTAWRKVPPIPKLTVATSPPKVRLTWDDGISLGSYHLYAVIAGHELYGCVFGDEDDSEDARWEKLTFVKAAPPSHNRRQPVSCTISNMDTEADYYFAVRPVDVHDRRGPFAIVYVRL